MHHTFPLVLGKVSSTAWELSIFNDPRCGMEMRWECSCYITSEGITSLLDMNQFFVGESTRAIRFSNVQPAWETKILQAAVVRKNNLKGLYNAVYVFIFDMRSFQGCQTFCWSLSLIEQVNQNLLASPLNLVNFKSFVKYSFNYQMR